MLNFGFGYITFYNAMGLHVDIVQIYLKNRTSPNQLLNGRNNRCNAPEAGGNPQGTRTAIPLTNMGRLVFAGDSRTNPN